MSKPAVEAHGLRKGYGEVQALDGLSLAVPAGSVLGLLGPNGPGKTTTVSILATSLRPDAGRGYVGGLDVVTEAAQVRRVIGLAGQFAAVDSACGSVTPKRPRRRRCPWCSWSCSPSSPPAPTPAWAANRKEPAMEILTPVKGQTA